MRPLMRPWVHPHHLLPVAALACLLVGLAACDSTEPNAPQFGTIAIMVAPDSLAAPWQLAGPYGISRSGTGAATLPNKSAGSYTLTWGAVPGWHAPAPQAVTQTLDGDDTLVFSGQYAPAVATITIDAEPDRIAAPWQLYGPEGLDEEGAGDLVISDLPPGNDHVNWLQTASWRRPDPDTETLTLVAGSALTFSGTYVPITGNLTVDVTPDGIGASWLVTGPDGFSRQGVEDQDLGEVLIGEYTVTWGDVEAYYTPEAYSWVVAEGATFTFSVHYELLALPFPDSTWVLMSNFLTSYSRMSAGDYAALLHPDFVTILQPGTVAQFPDVGPTLDAVEERRIHERMFSGHLVTDPEGAPVPAVERIGINGFMQNTVWDLSPADDPIPNTLCASYYVAFSVDRGQNHTLLRVDGTIRFYATYRDSLVDGVNRRYYQLVGQLDQTNGDKDAGAADKAVERVNWGSVKALFR